ICFTDVLLYTFFFFSSRRRHTRWPRDWSSDVCSSDLEIIEDIIEALQKYSEGYSFTAEIVAQVNTVLDGLKPAVIWAFLNQFVQIGRASCRERVRGSEEGA